MFLVYLEDPGAVGFIAPLLNRFIDDDIHYTLITSGVANDILVDLHPRSVNFFDEVATDILRSSLVLVGTSENTRSIAFDITHAAQKTGIPVIGAVDSFVNAPYRFAGLTDDALAHAPDWLLVPNERTVAAFVELGFLQKKIFAVGHPARYGIKNMNRTKTSQGPKRIVFVSEVSTGLNPSQYQRSETYTLRGLSGSNLRTQIVAEELLNAVSILRSAGHNVELILRLHPKELLDNFGVLADEFDIISAGGDPFESIISADLIVGMSSMLLSEACMMGLPCLSILPREEETSWLDEILDGSIPVVIKRDEILPAITKLLQKQTNLHHLVMKNKINPVDQMLKVLNMVKTQNLKNKS